MAWRHWRHFLFHASLEGLIESQVHCLKKHRRLLFQLSPSTYYINKTKDFYAFLNDEPDIFLFKDFNLIDG